MASPSNCLCSIRDLQHQRHRRLLFWLSLKRTRWWLYQFDPIFALLLDIKNPFEVSVSISVLPQFHLNNSILKLQYIAWYIILRRYFSYNLSLIHYGVNQQHRKELMFISSSLFACLVSMCALPNSRFCQNTKQEVLCKSFLKLWESVVNSNSKEFAYMTWFFPPVLSYCPHKSRISV